MIVRIATEDQYTLEDSHRDALNALDNETVAAVESGDEARFTELFAQMLDLVRREGTAVADEELLESEIILPPPDLSFAEAQQEFTGEGLIPD